MTKRLMFASTKNFFHGKNHDAILRLLSALFHYLTMASCKVVSPATIVFAQKLFSFFAKKFLSQGKFEGDNAVFKKTLGKTRTRFFAAFLLLTCSLKWSWCQVKKEWRNWDIFPDAYHRLNNLFISFCHILCIEIHF